jgi:5-methylcytosine-specific restriction enzyme subunit McrC
MVRQCRALANAMKEQGVSGIVPTRAQMSADRYGRHDAQGRLMVDAAKLAFELAMPTEDAGTYALPMPDREGAWVRKLFERAVGGFQIHVHRHKRLVSRGDAAQRVSVSDLQLPPFADR